MATIRVLLVDDHVIVRDGLKTLIGPQHGMEVVGEAESGKQALRLCKEEAVDLIIMDINMPEMNGIEATRKIREVYPEIKILALTMSDRDTHIRSMIQAGASGYILKNAGKKELKKATEALMEGRHYFSDHAAKSVMTELVRKKGKVEKAGPVRLTPRELEVLALIVNEHTNQEIADKLYISIRTVDAHRRNLLQKTGARNTAGLVRYALSHNLLESNR